MNINELLKTAQEYLNEPPPRPETPPAPAGKEIARWIDHTLLKADATLDQVTQLCHEAATYQFAAVCINPAYVPVAARLLAGSGVQVCTVVGFPLGATLTTVKVLETMACLDAGATEIDMVLSIGALKSQAYGQVVDDVRAVAETVHNRGAIVKVILETALLSRLEKIIACLLCKEAGADFVKTSTGFSTGGATPEDVELMWRTVGPAIKVKAAGGIRSYADAIAMIQAGASRIGASAGVRIVQEAGDVR